MRAFLAILLSLGSLLADDALVEEAYIYGFPLVVMDATKGVMTAATSLTETKAPVNQLLNMRTFPVPSQKDVVSPNTDTLYTTAWIDVSKEPVILSVPDMGGRYYLFPLLDEWTNVFYSPGTRTTGNSRQNFALTGPSWKGSLPADVQEIKSPTDIVWLIGRIRTDGKNDFAAVNKLQDQFKLTPLSSWGVVYIPPSTVSNAYTDAITPPLEQVLKLDGKAFFKKLAALLKTTPIPASDTEYVKKFAAIGLVPGKDFDEKKVKNLNDPVKSAQSTIKQGWLKPSGAVMANGWNLFLHDIGTYGTNYNQRASIAFGALGANLPQDAVYPATHTDDLGQPLSGQFRYTIHFDKTELPPVKGFWSLTLYNDHQYLHPNSLNRYSLSDSDPLVFNPDGSLDIYIQTTSPGSEKEANWLPAPYGSFNLILRLYEPKESVIKGTWKPPGVKRVKAY